MISLEYSNPMFPKHGFLFYELTERFMKDDREKEKLALLRSVLKILYSKGDAENFKSLIETTLFLDQKKGIVTVLERN